MRAQNALVELAEKYSDIEALEVVNETEVLILSVANAIAEEFSRELEGLGT